MSYLHAPERDRICHFLSSAHVNHRSQICCDNFHFAPELECLHCILGSYDESCCYTMHELWKENGNIWELFELCAVPFASNSIFSIQIRRCHRPTSQQIQFISQILHVISVTFDVEKNWISIKPKPTCITWSLNIGIPIMTQIWGSKNSVTMS